MHTFIVQIYYWDWAVNLDCPLPKDILVMYPVIQNVLHIIYSNDGAILKKCVLLKIVDNIIL